MIKTKKKKRVNKDWKIEKKKTSIAPGIFEKKVIRENTSDHLY